MIKKIINWTASGFFRKLGSILVYIAIISIVAILSLKKGITIEKLLGIEQVYATQANWSTATLEIKQCDMFNENCIFDTASLGDRIYIGGDKTYVPQFQWLIYGGSNNTYKANNVYSMHIRQAISVLDYDLIENLYLFQYFSNTSSSTSGAISGYSNANLYSMSCSLSQYDTYAFDINCNFVPKRDIKYISVQLYLSDYDYSVDSQTDVRWTTLEMSYEEDVSSIINNQTTIIQNEFNETNQNITDIKDFLQNDSIESESNVALDYFSTFNISNHNLLSQMILLPVDFLNSLVVGSTNDLCFDFRGQHICLPNGQTTLWQKNFGGGCHDYSLVCTTNTNRNNFVTFFNLVVGGFLSYKLISKIIKLWHDSLDPVKDTVEVMKL